MNLGNLLDLADLESDDQLRDACRAIVLGLETKYEFQTRGAGRSFELIVVELERIRTVPGTKARSRAEALVHGVRSAAAEIATNIEESGDLSSSAATLVGNWALLVGLMDQPGLDAAAQRLFTACARHSDSSRRAFLASAEAVTSTFADVDEGVCFWKEHLRTQARHYAVDYLLRHRPQDPAVRAGIASLFVASIEGYISADPELLLADAFEAVSSDVGINAGENFLADVFGQIPASYQVALTERLNQRSFSRPWIRFLDAATPPIDFLAPEASEPLQVILREQGLDPQGFRPNPVHPDAINDAIRHYLQHQQSLLTVSRSRRIQLRSINYPATFPKSFQATLNQFEQELNEIQARVSNAFGADFGTSETPIADLDSRLALRVKVLLLVSFFFFTEQRRKDSWGVIPVGQHCAFGLVLPQDLFAKLRISRSFAEADKNYSGAVQTGHVGAVLEAMSQERRKALSIGGARWRRDATMTFLAKLIRYLDKEKDGQIIYRRGFVMGDLLVEMMRSDEKGPDLVPLLNEMLREEVTADPKGDESDLSIFPKMKNVHEYIEPDGDVLSRRCALFDLGQIEVVQKALSHEEARDRYHIVLIQHGLDVPVGLGFSLPLLPTLLKRADWSGSGREAFLYAELRRIAIETFVRDGDANRIEDFLRIGIDLTNLEPYFDTAHKVTHIHAKP